MYGAFGTVDPVSGTPMGPDWGGQKMYYQDTETGLYLLGMGTNGRYYDPATGRFITEDPMGLAAGDINLYTYVGNNPVSRNDPSGTEPTALVAADSPNAQKPMEIGEALLSDSYVKLPGTFVEIGGKAYQVTTFVVSSPTELQQLLQEQAEVGRVLSLDLLMKVNAESNMSFKVLNEQFAIAMPALSYDPIATEMLRKARRDEGLERNSVGAPGPYEELIPLWGSGRSLLHSIQIHDFSFTDAAIFVSDIFLVKSLWTTPLRLLAHDAALGSERLAIPAGEKIAWQASRTPGVRIAKLGNLWLKEVDPGSNLLARWWGRGTLVAQARGLELLKGTGVQFYYINGRIITLDAGKFSGSIWQALATRAVASWRLGTIWNDVVPRNIGSAGKVFDPALHPLDELARHLLPPVFLRAVRRLKAVLTGDEP